MLDFTPIRDVEQVCSNLETNLPCLRLLSISYLSLYLACLNNFYLYMLDISCALLLYPLLRKMHAHFFFNHWKWYLCFEEKCRLFGPTLSQYAMNHTRLESIFLKKHTPHIHEHKTQHTHAHHTHTHDLYANVHACTRCGCRATLKFFVMTE